MKTPKPTFTNGFGSFRYDISFLWDDLNAENIRNGNELPVYHLDHAVDRVDPLDRSGDSLVAQRRKSNNRLRQTFERKLVETAHFQNKDTVLQ